MKNNHQNFLYMCKKVKRFYRKYDTILDTSKGIKNYFISLNSLVDKLQMEFDQSISYSNGFSIERARKRDMLQAASLIISKDLMNLKENMKYKQIEELKQFVGLEYIELSTLNEVELIDYSSNLYDLMSLCEARLKNSGTKQKEIDAFSNALTLCALDFPMNRYSIELRKQASLLSLKAYSDLMEFFHEKLDISIEAFKKSNPELYNDYQLARKVDGFDLNQTADFEGELTDGKAHKIAEFRYDMNREFRVSVTGGNAVWGLSNNLHKIDHGRPINTREKISVKSMIIGNDGNFLVIQSVNPENPINYKVWVTEP